MAVKEGTYCIVAGRLQQYKDGAWIDVSTVVRGEKGEKGDKGDTGAIGAQGERGEKGEQGVKGDTGATGAPGTDGVSPTITEDEANNADTYKLVITDVNGTIITPNLKGADGTGGGGTTDHAALANLAYNDSGHTGFASQAALDAVEAKIITDHSVLTGKDATSQHPISAITGLQTQLSGLSIHNNLTGLTAIDAHPVSSITGLETRFTQVQAQIEGITYVREGVFVGRWDFFRQDPLPSGWIPLDGRLIANVAATMPELVAYLGTRFNETISQSEWDAMSAAASGIGGVPYYVYDTGADTLRMPDVRGDSAYYGASGVWQGDAIRNITGSLEGNISIGSKSVVNKGAFTANRANTTGNYSTGGTLYAWMTNLSMDASRTVPTDTTNHPRRVGLIWAVYAGVIN